MFVQVDADMIAYQIGHSMDSKGLQQGLIKSIVTKKVDSYLSVAKKVGKISDLAFYLTSNDRSNYRFEITDQYKANRKETKRPKYFFDIREFIADYYSADIIDGMEADDQLSINAWRHNRSGKKNDLCLTISGDKDLRIAPGLHYEMNDAPIYEVHWPGYLSIFRRSGTNIFGTGLAWFYYQLLAGDKIDNVQNIGLSQIECYHVINITLHNTSNMRTELKLYEAVERLYHKRGYTQEQLIQNARLLWLKTDEDEPLWQPPI